MERQFSNAWEKPPHFANVNFMIETLDGRPIGHTGLHGAAGETRVAEFGILIGEKDCWSSGYGTDATRTLLRFGFEQMNLHKVVLGANADNARGIRCYEKAGFVLEGTRRECAWRGSRWLDRVIMSVLREDWERSRA
jgi:RimJ/RimL family protein N-acetyltransferase